MFAIELGAEVRDDITNFKGFVTGRAQYITGCNQYLVTAPYDDAGKRIADPGWFDENRLSVSDPAPVRLMDFISRLTPKTRENGPDLPAPIK